MNPFQKLYAYLNKGKIPANQKLFIGFAAMCEFFLGNLVGGSIMMFYSDYVGLDSNSTYGIAYLIFGIYNMINDPIFAYLSDKRSPDAKYGKRKFNLILGPIIFLIGFFILVSCPRSLQEVGKFVWLLVAFFIYDTGIALFNVNLSALMITLTKEPDERATLSLVKSYIILIPGGIGGLFPAYVFTSGFTYEQIMLSFVVITLLLFVISYASILKINEPKELYLKIQSGNNVSPTTEQEFDVIEYGFWTAVKETLKSQSFRRYLLFAFFAGMMCASSFEQLVYLMKWVYDIRGIYATLIAAIGGLIINLNYIVINQVRKRIGIVNSLYITLTLTAIGYLILFLMDGFWWCLFGYVLGCIGFSTYYFMSGIMIGDVADEDYVKNGKNRQAMFGSVVSLVAVPASSLLVFIFTLIQDYYGYDGNLVTQSPSAMFGIRLGVGLLRVFLTIITIITLSLYPLKGKRYEELRKQVDEIEQKRNKLLQKQGNTFPNSASEVKI